MQEIEVSEIEMLKQKLEEANYKISSLQAENIKLNTLFNNYKSIFNDTLDVVMITDGKEGKILDINNSCINQLGYSPDELKGIHFSHILEDPEQEKTLLEDTRFFGMVLAERRIRKKDGSVCFMDLMLSNIEYNNSKVVMTILRDVSERVRAELKLREYSETLSDLNASKDKFFSIIAHDLKSPFSGLLGLSQILCEELDEMGNSELKKYADELNNSAKFIFKLLQNLLEWSRLNTGKFDYLPTEINLAKKFNSIYQLLNLNASNKGISLSLNAPDDIIVFADNNMLNSILQNLISNAIKYTNSEGTVEVNALRNDNMVIITVKDSGIGMPEDNLKKIFRVDKNISTPGTANERGTGLGLVLCKELAEKNKGSISAESRQGEGTTFTVTLPAVYPHA